jgi:hypothetical protein
VSGRLTFSRCDISVRHFSGHPINVKIDEIIILKGVAFTKEAGGTKKQYGVA